MRETKCMNRIKGINQEAENRKRRRLTTKRLIYLLK